MDSSNANNPQFLSMGKNSLIAASDIILLGGMINPVNVLHS